MNSRFQRGLGFTKKSRRKHWKSVYIPLSFSILLNNFPTAKILHYCGTLVAIDELILINYQNPQFVLAFTPGVVLSMGFNKCMTCIHIFVWQVLLCTCIVHNTFTTLKMPCSIYSFLHPVPQMLAITDPFTFFLLISECWNHILYNLYILTTCA
jgi:hypothetical protein